MSSTANQLLPGEVNPLHSLDEWENDVLERYPDPNAIATDKSTEAYRNYEAPARDTVKEFYRLNHTYQTFDFVKQKQPPDFILIQRAIFPSAVVLCNGVQTSPAILHMP